MRTRANLLFRLLSIGALSVLLVIADTGGSGTKTVRADNIAQTSPSDWQQTPAMVSEKNIRGYCFDPNHTSTIIISDGEAGTVAYDWRKGERTLLNSRPFQMCGPDGLLYARDDTKTDRDGPTWRFSIDDPSGLLIAHLPTSVAMDGTSRVYSFDVYYQPSLLLSEDGGLSWEDIGKSLSGRILGYAMSDMDSRILYVVATESATAGGTYIPPFSTTPETEMTYHNRVYFTADGGHSWEKRGTVDTFDDYTFRGSLCDVALLPGSDSVVDLLSIAVCRRARYSNGGARNYLNLSTDGGRTFQITEYDPGYAKTYFYHTHEGSLRLRGFGSQSSDLALSTDGGKNWGAMPLPDGMPIDPFYLKVVPQLPFMVFAQAHDEHGHFYKYYSIDGANSWHPIDYSGSGAYPPTTPFSPAMSFMVGNGKLYMHKWEGDGQSLLVRSDRNQVPGGAYLEETGHNLFGAFKAYWDAHGGLAQLGYPITERFSEVSSVDSKAYITQYFERAVMELHPENQPPYNLLLSLLGVEAYRQKYGAAGAPHQQVSTDNPLCFTQTGYTIGGKFRAYWEQHGGIDQQGYPISDEFEEVNPVDGNGYTVQYFERARFELHPENAGTPFEVLLGQLGTAQFSERYVRK